VASSEERVWKFLKRPLEKRSALEVAKSLSSPQPRTASLTPGRSLVALAAINKRWDLNPHSPDDLAQAYHALARGGEAGEQGDNG
jgi:hypothetical protein